MIPSLLNRDEYPSFREGVYLNQASLGLIGQPAVNAMQVFIEEVARHGNFNMSDVEKFDFRFTTTLLDQRRHFIDNPLSIGENAWTEIHCSDIE